MSVTRIDLDEFETANRYLAGRLNDAECAAFETRLVQDPQLVRDLEAIARFKVGLQVLHSRGELDEATRAPRWSYRLLAVAAAVAILAFGTLMFRNVFAPSVPSLLAAVPAALTDRQGNVLPSAGTFTVLRSRATTADAVIELPPPGHAIEVRVLPESPSQEDGYNVSWWRQPRGAVAEKLGSLGHVSAAADGFLVVFLDTTRLTPGEYLLVVSPTNAGDPSAGRDVFRISLTAR
ncbi:MAG: hypothetical protein WDO68_22275 [Gammaproteobacteria bacterium]